MLESLTRDASDNKDLIVRIIRNFRTNQAFAKEAISFIMQRLLGRHGLPRFYQMMLGAYFALMIYLMVYSGNLHGTKVFGIATILSFAVNFAQNIASLVLVYRNLDECKVRKLHITRDSRSPDHLISHIL